MTRINCVHPRVLSRQHLIAEYRELPRVFSLAQKRIAARRRPEQCVPADFKDIPSTYRMGSGHVLFFIDKLGWCSERHKLLVCEMHDRGYRPSLVHTIERPETIPEAFWGSWKPTPEAVAVNWYRLRERDRTHYPRLLPPPEAF